MQAFAVALECCSSVLLDNDKFLGGWRVNWARFGASNDISFCYRLSYCRYYFYTLAELNPSFGLILCDMFYNM